MNVNCMATGVMRWTTAPVLEANGLTPTGQAVSLALSEIEAENSV